MNEALENEKVCAKRSTLQNFGIFKFVTATEERVKK
jgi:hypothetical protein